MKFWRIFEECLILGKKKKNKVRKDDYNCEIWKLLPKQQATSLLSRDSAESCLHLQCFLFSSLSLSLKASYLTNILRYLMCRIFNKYAQFVFDNEAEVFDLGS